MEKAERKEIKEEKSRRKYGKGRMLAQAYYTSLVEKGVVLLEDFSSKLNYMTKGYYCGQFLVPSIIL